MADSGTPIDIWHNRTLAWTVTPWLSRADCLALLADARVLALLTRVHAGHSVEWSGSNFIGLLTPDARAASEDLEHMLAAWPPTDDMMEAETALGDSTGGEYVDAVLADGLAAAAAGIVAELEANGLTLVDDMSDALRDLLRDWADTHDEDPRAARLLEVL